jgi:DNA polymerase
MMNLPHDILLFYRDAGCDAALDDTPVNRLVTGATVPVRPEPGPPARATSVDARAEVPTARNQQVTLPDASQVANARELAQNSATLDALREALAGFDGCNLKFTAKNLVFADGNPEARVMLIGEAPGRDDDLDGKLFSGQVGQLLDRMLAAIGLDRTTVHIANAVPWRPPGDRTPTDIEAEICRPFIERQIELASPELVIALGPLPSRLIGGVSEGILKARGKWVSHETKSGKRIRVLPTLHPAYLLRNPGHKRLVWRDLLSLAKALDNDRAPS